MFFYCCLILFYLFLFLLVSINQLVSNFNRTLDNEGNLRAELAGTRLITANQRRELVEQVRVQPGEGHEWVVWYACLWGVGGDNPTNWIMLLWTSLTNLLHLHLTPFTEATDWRLRCHDHPDAGRHPHGSHEEWPRGACLYAKSSLCMYPLIYQRLYNIRVCLNR